MAESNRRQSTGTDGKYETVGGRQRSKWNNYSSVRISTNPIYNMFDIICHYPVPPYAPNVPVMVQDGCAWDPSKLLGSNPQQSVTDNQKNKAFSQLLEKIKGSDFNLGVELGQLNQTVGLLAGNLGKLGRAALALRRGDFSTAARQLGTSARKNTSLKAKDISGRWLELQYGWLPLLSSSFDAMQAFKALSDGPRTKMFLARNVELRELEISSSANYTGKAKYKVGRRLQYEMYEELSAARQLGLVDPLSIAWELTPWSFVIDWFFPFGNYLSNLNQIPKLKGRWLVTDFIKIDWTEVQFKYNLTKYAGVRVIDGIPRSPRARIRSNHMIRTYSSTPPAVPLPDFNFGGVNSTRRFYNALALAHGRFLK
jgi:hypothetical protein